MPRVAGRLEELRHLDRPVLIRAIHRESLVDVVRVTIELDDEVRYHAERLEEPARLFVDLRDTYAAPPLRTATLSFDDGDVVREIRLGRHPGQTTRVVLDIEDVDTYSVFTQYNPYRLVVNAVPTASRQTRRTALDRPTSSAITGCLSPPPTDQVNDPSPVETAEISETPTAETTSVLLPVTEGLKPRRLETIQLFLAPDTGESIDIDPATSTYESLTDPKQEAASVPHQEIPAAIAQHAVPETANELTWLYVHDVLYPNIGSPPTLENAERMPTEDETEPPVDLISLAPLRTPEAIEPATLLIPGPIVDQLSPPQPEQKIQIAHQPPAPTDSVVAGMAVESLRYRESRTGTYTLTANADGNLSLGRQLGLGVSRIVIDPGHGGYDPGAQSGELTESALVLDVARRLETRLKTETGIEVVLTRRRDVYVPLRARTELANRVGADLFLSIHANAAMDQRAGGVETYYLDLTTDPSAQTVAARENASTREGMHNLTQLVRSITMHNKLHESRDLARMVQRNLLSQVRELHPDAQDLGVKRAPFVVLIGTKMPSVLAEISFLTNQQDAAFLATDAYRDRIADAFLQSILEYQQTLKRSTNFAAENNE